MAITPWLHHADHPLAPICRSRRGSNMAIGDTRYQTLCGHYGMELTRNNPGVAHENGSIESPHGHLKSVIRDALLLRGTRNFDTLTDYQSFIDEITSRKNARNTKRIEAQRAHLRRCRQQHQRLRGDNGLRHPLGWGHAA